jgi:CBS domain-containing protein
MLFCYFRSPPYVVFALQAMAKLKIRGTIDSEAGLLQALKIIYNNKITVLPVYEGDKLIGVVRDSDLFLTVADILME